MTTTRLFSGVVAAAIVAVGMSVPVQAQTTTIDGSKHDLAVGTITDAGGAVIGSDNGEICVYCHTPHASETTIAAPLWNKPQATASYTSVYDGSISTTIDGTVLSIGSVSIACLSCHDGAQAMDTVINAPGTNGFNAAGARMNTLGGTGTIDDAAATFPNRLTINPVANIGTDLTNDHPISILYGGFDLGGATPDPVDPDFVTPASDLISGITQWWVDTSEGTNGIREKSDMILYRRDNGGVFQPFVECASCHDPHDPSNGTFLRIANNTSAVCLACHVK